MNGAAELALALIVGLIGWRLAKRLRVPAAGILGPMLLVGILASAGLPIGGLPAWSKTILQVVIGSFAGAGISRKTLGDTRAIAGSVTFVTVWVVGSALAIGYLVSLLTDVGPATALLGTSPGGLPEMSAVALSFGADVPVVAVMQACRILTTMAVVPFLAKHGRMGIAARSMEDATAPEATGLPSNGYPVSDSGAIALPTPTITSSSLAVILRLGWPATIAIGGLGAALLTVIGVPAGAIIGSLLAVATANAATAQLPRPPVALRTAAQLGMGILIGESFTPATVALLQASAPTILLATAATIVSSLALASFVRRQVHSDSRTALLACAPAGLSQMALVVDEVGGDLALIMVFQLTRMICAVVVLPFLFRLLL